MRPKQPEKLDGIERLELGTVLLERLIVIIIAGVVIGLIWLAVTGSGVTPVPGSVTPQPLPTSYVR